MDQQQYLRDIVKWRKPRKRKTEALLGEMLGKIMEKQISPKQGVYDIISQAWEQLLPEQLRQHCKIVDINAGRIKVLVDSPSYLHEFRLCSCQLLEELQKLCPKARVKKINFSLS
ncbi:MAG: DUF721 domain-containing protein [Planctomycetes bacterium]|nr:DUF721 domain-containing protein [Planctomycetota bacterium]